MRKALLGSLLILLGSAGLTLAQAPPPGNPAVNLDPVPMTAHGDSVFDWNGHGGDGSSTCAWGSVEYLLWWVKDAPLPFPFVLTGPVNGPPPNNNPGALNEAGFPTLTGKGVDFGALSGVRATVGGYLDSEGTIGIEGSGFILPQQSKTYRAASDANGNPTLGFRYLDTAFANNLAEDIFQASIPPGNANGVGPFSGSVAVISQIRLWGAEINGVIGTAGSGGLRLQALAGFRYVDLSESLGLQLQSTALDGSVVFFQGTPFGSPASILTIDSFQTRNQFYAGQVGLRGEYCMGGLVLTATSKLAVGNNHESINVTGSSTLNPNPGPIQSVPVGQFAGPSNIGRRTGDEFDWMPEFELKIGYQITSWARATIGYDFLYIYRVVRPGSQVDLVVNDTVNPVNAAFGGFDPTKAPQPFFGRHDFWAQGLTFGVELRF
jgi:hypothetical protein